MSKPDNNRAGAKLGADTPKTVDINSIPDPVLIINKNTNRISAVNDATCNLFACQSDELIGVAFVEVCTAHTDEATDGFAETTPDSRFTEQLSILEDGDLVNINTMNGDVKPVKITFGNTTQSGGDHVMVILRDATERIKRDQKLQATNDRLETLLEALPVPVAVLSPKGTVERWNLSAEKLYNYSADEIVGEQYSHFVNNSDFSKLREKVRGGKSVSGYKTVHRTREGSHIDVELYAQPQYKNGKLSEIIVATIDTSDQRRRVQQLEVLQRTLRHNIRNKLNVVQGHLELLDEEMDDATGSIAAAATAADEVLMRAEAAQQIRTPARNQDTFKQSVPTLVETATAEYEDIDGLAIDIEVADVSIYAVGKFETAIEHAIENVAKHTEPPVTVRFSTEVLSDEVKLVIADDGKGIPDAELQVVNSEEETPLEHGSGMGLWAMKWLTEQSGGRFGVDTDPTGTTVWMRLPKA